MGSIPYDGGTTFRVWAPHAQAVFVTGTFDGWAMDATPLAPDDAATNGGGTWSADVDGRWTGHRVPVHHPHPGRRLPAHGSLRPPGDQLGGQQRRVRPGRVRLGRRPLPGPGLGRPRDLRDAHRHVLGDGRQARHVRLRPPPPAVPAEAGRVRHPGHAALRVRRRHLVGLQPGRTCSPSSRATAGRTPSSASSTMPTDTGSRSSSMSSSTTSARPTSTCGGSTAGRRATGAASTSTTTIGPRRPGAGRGPTTAAARSARSCGTAR